jgi:hypothetical protein
MTQVETKKRNAENKDINKRPRKKRQYARNLLKDQYPVYGNNCIKMIILELTLTRFILE